MSSQSADVVICGAGIAGVAAAWHLSVRQGMRNVVLVDARDPMTLTSDKGTQGYRNWWPGPDDTMLKLVSRSLDLLEETARDSGNVFRMSRRGYLFATAETDRVATLEATARQVSAFGMGDVRVHRGGSTYEPASAEGFGTGIDGADLLLDDEVRRAFPYLAPDTVGALHIRRAGWLNGVGLGNRLLAQAVAAGTRFARDGVVAVNTNGGRVRGVSLASGVRIDTERFVIAAGPGLPNVAAMLGLELPVFHELHAKFTMRDTKRAVPRHAPFVIWTDPMSVEWSDVERTSLASTEDGRRMLAPLPGGVHLRPVDLTHGDELYLIWTFETGERPYVWPPAFDTRYGDAVVRGCSRMIPAMQAYGGVTDGVVDGGYYCKTPENRPLIGPLAVDGAFVLGALSGSGLMAAHASAELLSLHVVGGKLPEYAPWFLASRYEDAAYRERIAGWGALSGQL